MQVPVTAANASALPKTGGCLGIYASVTTESVTNTMASSAQVGKHIRSSESRMLDLVLITAYRGPFLIQCAWFLLIRLNNDYPVCQNLSGMIYHLPAAAVL